MSYAITAFVEEHEDLAFALIKNSIVFKNAASAEFGDLFVRYVSTDDDFADDDDNGNVVLTSEEIKKQRIITILFTTKAINPDLHYSIRSAIPDDVLVVCRDNFHQHFGIFGTALKDSLRDLKLKRPFHSPKDFKDRVAFKDRVSFDNDDGINAGSRMHAPFQKRKVLQTRVAFQTIT
ncbi:5247_t:CDS:2 [Rhizophagus irregularis]|nr:5247_t:CDS:2 [Rhizophagus irregularis]